MDTTAQLRDQGQQFLATLWTSERHAHLHNQPQQLCNLLELITQVKSQLEGLELAILTDANTTTAADRIADVYTNTPAEKPYRQRATVRLAQTLEDRFPPLRNALREGTISQAQAAAITDGLTQLPLTLSGTELERCQTTMIGLADELNPTELRIAALRMLEVVDPEGAEELQRRRLEIEERRAQQLRHLRLTPDGHGSMTIKGKLPLADGALLRTQLQALTPPLTSYQHEGFGDLPAAEARLADALVLLTQVAANSGHLPADGNDRPHVIITLDYQTLHTGLGNTLLPDGTQLPPGDARRLACDAGLIPTVLNSPSQPLDIGREQRFFTKAQRTALTLRDTGCVFPGCNTPPAACHAHHIQPWWEGGETTLNNGVLLCPHHHRQVEPDPQQAADSPWQVKIDPETGLAWFTPPRHIDPDQKPRLHTRLKLRHLEPEALDPGEESARRPPPEPDKPPPGHIAFAGHWIPAHLLDNEWNRAS